MWIQPPLTMLMLLVLLVSFVYATQVEGRGVSSTESDESSIPKVLKTMFFMYLTNFSWWIMMNPQLKMSKIVTFFP